MLTSSDCITCGICEIRYHYNYDKTIEEHGVPTIEQLINGTYPENMGKTGIFSMFTLISLCQFKEYCKENGFNIFEESRFISMKLDCNEYDNKTLVQFVEKCPCMITDSIIISRLKSKELSHIVSHILEHGDYISKFFLKSATFAPQYVYMPDDKSEIFYLLPTILRDVKLSVWNYIKYHKLLNDRMPIYLNYYSPEIAKTFSKYTSIIDFLSVYRKSLTQKNTRKTVLYKPPLITFFRSPIFNLNLISLLIKFA